MISNCSNSELQRRCIYILVVNCCMSALPKYPDNKGLEKEIRFCTFEPVGSRQQ